VLARGVENPSCSFVVNLDIPMHYQSDRVDAEVYMHRIDRRGKFGRDGLAISLVDAADLPRIRAEFPVGEMGLGVLGERVAKALQVFEFPVLGYSRSPKKLPGIRSFSGAQGLPDFLKATRVLVNLMPLTAETENMLNHSTLSQLQTGGYVINVARGKHLVEEDLITLIDSGHLAGATLDVFRIEPLPADNPLWAHPKITVTPHTSARTLREESIAQIVGKIESLQRGEPINGVVDPQRGY
jgi:glyoxylate/hydroxypyruvate reductase A